MRLVIGLFKVNTQATQNVSVANRVEYVKAAVEELKRYSESVEKSFKKPDPVEMRAVFLAPEYAFARSVSQGVDHAFGQQRQLEEDYVKDTWRPIFERLSKGFRNALIVPGTVAWRKGMKPATAGDHGSVQEREVYRRKKYTDRIGATADINLSEGYVFNKDTPVFPEGFKKPADTRAALPSAASKMTAIQTKTAHYVAKNTAHCYYNGNCVYKYNKIGDFYEVCEDTEKTIIVPNRSKVSGTTVGAGRFSAGGLDIGISICYDQSLSVQVMHPTMHILVHEPLQKTASTVDIHILLSAHIPPQVGNANLKPGGLLLSCSSDSKCNAVMYYEGGISFKYADQADIKGMAKLDMYQIFS